MTTNPAPVPTPDSCAVCQFSTPTLSADGPILLCRRFPPTAIATGDHMHLPDGTAEMPAVSLFPAVDESTWCGEFSPTGR